MSEETKKRIEELSVWDMPDTVIKPDGYERKTVPEATTSNIIIIVEKINELIKEVNKNQQP